MEREGTMDLSTVLDTKRPENANAATTSDDFYETDIKSHDSHVTENGCEGC